MSNDRVSTYASTHQLHGTSLSFDLTTESEEVRSVAMSAESGHTAKTLVKEGALSVTLVSLRKGSTLEPHKVAGPTSIQTLDGSLKLTTGTTSANLAPGSLALLDADVTHSAEALEDCTLLLTLVVSSKPGG